MIRREDMLELTRRMTPKRNCFTRIAGGYMDAEGFVDQSFNIHFGKLSPSETEQMIQIVKAVPFSETNEELKDYAFPGKAPQSLQVRQTLDMLIQCGLKNDALLQTFYELVGEKYVSDQDYAIIVCQGDYDIPRMGTDKERQWESEEVYSFLICAVCPQTAPNDPGPPDCGFLYPSFADRSRDLEHIAVYQRGGGRSSLLEILGI